MEIRATTRDPAPTNPGLDLSVLAADVGRRLQRSLPALEPEAARRLLELLDELLPPADIASEGPASRTQSTAPLEEEGSGSTADGPDYQLAARMVQDSVDPAFPGPPPEEQSSA